MEESSFSKNILFYWETLYRKLPYRWEDYINISKAFMATEVSTLSQLCQVVEGLKISILLEWLSLACVWPGCIWLLHTVKYWRHFRNWICLSSHVKARCTWWSTPIHFQKTHFKNWKNNEHCYE
jgi:hypothetical protein